MHSTMQGNHWPTACLRKRLNRLVGPVTCTGGMAGCDGLCLCVSVLAAPVQDLVKALEQHDYVRALRMASYGFLLYGPFSHLWYQFLERHLPGATAKNLSLKVGRLGHGPGQQGQSCSCCTLALLRALRATCKLVKQLWRKHHTHSSSHLLSIAL